MASNYTTNYNLCQWQPTDQVQRTDFNADNAKLDAALAGLAGQLSGKADHTGLEDLEQEVESLSASVPKIVTGSYSGTTASEQTINLGFTPKAVLVCSSQGKMSFTYTGSAEYWGGLALLGAPVYSAGGRTVLEIVTNGFKVHYFENGSDRIYINLGGYAFRYLAIG